MAWPVRHGGIDALVGDVEGSGHWRTFQVVGAARRQAIAHGGTTATVSSPQDGHLLAREAGTIGHPAALAWRASIFSVPCLPGRLTTSLLTGTLPVAYWRLRDRGLSIDVEPGLMQWVGVVNCNPLVWSHDHPRF